MDQRRQQLLDFRGGNSNKNNTPKVHSATSSLVWKELRREKQIKNGQILNKKTETLLNDGNRIFQKSFVLQGMVLLPRGSLGNVRAFKVPVTLKLVGGPGVANRWSSDDA